MVEWLVRETQNFLIAVGRRSNPIPKQIFLIRGLFLFFLLHFLELLFVASLVLDFFAS